MDMKKDSRLLRMINQLDRQILFAREKIQQLVITREGVDTGIKKLQEQANEHHLELSRKARQVRENEELIKAAQEQIKKYNIALNTIKSNEDYRATQGYIKDEENKIEGFEETIVQLYLDTDELQKIYDQEQERIQVKQKDVDDEHQRIDSEVKEAEINIEQINQEKEELIKGLNGAVRETYKKVLARNKDLAISVIIGDQCGGCYSTISSQLRDYVRLGKEVFTCKVCARILVEEQEEQDQVEQSKENSEE